jgi:hypothetical protein
MAAEPKLKFRQLTIAKWEVRDEQGRWLADGRTKKTARERALLSLVSGLTNP